MSKWLEQALAAIRRASDKNQPHVVHETPRERSLRLRQARNTGPAKDQYEHRGQR